MNSAELLSLYNQRVRHFSELLTGKKTTINRISTARVGAALLILAAAYFSFLSSAYLVLFFIAITTFVALVKWHSMLFSEKERLENLVKVNKNEIAALNGDYSAQSRGNEFLDPLHAYASDLDIVGEASVFQYLNRANTAAGKEMLAGRLLSPLTSAHAIIETQKAVHELSSQLEFRQQVQAIGMNINDTGDDRFRLRAWVAHPYLLYSKKLSRYLLFLLPLLTITAIALSFFIVVAKPFALLLVLTQWTIMGLYSKRINVFHDYVSRRKEVLMRYARLLKVINDQKFNAQMLIALQLSTRQAEEKVSSLASLVSALDARLNFMTSLVVNALFLYDMQCVYRLEQWKVKNALELENWLDAISNAEVLTSFATYAYNNGVYCYPTIIEKHELFATGISHPLLGEKERATNSITLGSPHTVFIITGANMAGKSTFLRTLGVNLVLALNGAPVCAMEFCCPVINLRTGMRTTDSLKDHQSYFYAELQRLKVIVEDLRSGKPLLVLLDEILKGTNSTDKLAGSVALVKQLMQYPCLVVVATHDLALGNLETEFPNTVINYHFEPTIENDQLSFDYRLKRGIAEKMNATFLMKKMGIV